VSGVTRYACICVASAEDTEKSAMWSGGERPLSSRKEGVNLLVENLDDVGSSTIGADDCEVMQNVLIR
jgi:hypothetical protein